MRTVEAFDVLPVNERDARTRAFDYFASDGDKQTFDFVPCDVRQCRLGKHGGQRLRLSAVHVIILRWRRRSASEI